MTEIVDALLSLDNKPQGPVMAWGTVIDVSPTKVRFSGDIVDVEVTTKLSGYTPTTNDKVVLLKIGTAWVIIGDIG